MFYNDDDFYDEESVTFFLVKVFTSVNLSGKKYGNAERMIAVTFITVNDFKSFEGGLNKVMQKKWMNDNNDIHEYTFKWHCNSGTPLNGMI